MCSLIPEKGWPALIYVIVLVSGDMTVIDWARLLRCTECGVRDADFVVAGGERWG
jgi:hypothetical protein